MTIQCTLLAPALSVALGCLVTFGTAHGSGTTTPPSPDFEAAQLRRAALAGDPAAAMRLGEALLDRAEHDDMPEPHRLQVKADGEGLLGYAAQAGHLPAMWALANRHQAGRGLELAPERTKDWLMRLAQAGDNEAHWRLFGMASEQSIDGNAVRHLRLAAQAGHALALAAYFERLEQGQIQTDDAEEAQRDLELARRHNIRISDDLKDRLAPSLAAPMSAGPTPVATEPAMAELGARMATMQTHIDELLGETRTLRDELRARDQTPVEIAADEASEPPSDVDVAGAANFQGGLDALRAGDPVRARKRFGAAAKAGHVGAQNNLGLMLLRGLGGRAEPETGIGLLQQAADAGSASAAETLAAAFHYGVGVLADRRKALAWYELAAARGSAPAQEGLQRLAGVGPARAR